MLLVCAKVPKSSSGNLSTLFYIFFVVIVDFSIFINKMKFCDFWKQHILELIITNSILIFTKQVYKAKGSFSFAICLKYGKKEKKAGMYALCIRGFKIVSWMNPYWSYVNTQVTLVLCLWHVWGDKINPLVIRILYTNFISFTTFSF